MNVLQIVRDERPDVAPLDTRTREDLRARVVGESTRDRPEPLLVDDDVVMPGSGPAGVTQRRYWLSLAAIVLVAAGLAAVIVAVTRPEPSAPAAPSATTPGSGSPAYEPDTVPVVESLPDPFTAVANDDASDDGSATTTSATGAPSGPGLTPLALAQPPDGYELRQASFGTGPGGRGIVRYGADTHTTQLQLILRDAPDFFANVRDLGRQTWDIDGHTVYSDGELDGCLHDVCSIGLQWDEHTAISILWVDPNGDALVPGSDQASLLELVPKLVESPQVWQESSAEPFAHDRRPLT